MNLLLIVAILVVVGYLGGLYLFGRRGKLSFYTGGVEFVLIGAALGSGYILPEPEAILHDLFPFVHIELGWIGLLYGIQLDRRILNRHAAADWLMMFAETMIPMGLLLGTAYLLLSSTLSSDEGLMTAVMVLAAAGSISSPWAVGVIHQFLNQRTTLMRRLKFIVGMDDGPGLVLFIAVFFLTAGNGLDMLWRFAGSTFAGIALGRVIQGVLRKPGADYEPILIIAGSVLLAAGIAYTMGLPAIYITIVSGIVLANSKPRLRDLYPVIAAAEHPFYLIFLILAGALWNPTNFQALSIALILITVRLFGKWLAFAFLGKRLGFTELGGRLVMTVISPGGISIAMVMNYAVYTQRFPLSGLVLDITVWALIILSPLGVVSAREALATPQEGVA